MRTYVRLRDPAGELHELSPGDIIGRLGTAAMCIDDARVSEAHAMVSLRGRELKLLSLRGLFALDRKPLRELVLAQGQRIALAPGLRVAVEELSLPQEVLAVAGPGLPPQVLSGVSSLLHDPQPRLRAGYQPKADAVFWSTGAGWRLQLGDQGPRPLEPGDSWTLQGQTFHALAVPLDQAGQDATRMRSGIQAPLTLITRFDTVHIHRGGQPAVAISGIPARILSELASVAAPVGWEAVASTIWRDLDRNGLRRRWDVNLARLRRKLADARLRPDLVRADGSGNIELVLYPEDQLDDQS